MAALELVINGEPKTLTPDGPDGVTVVQMLEQLGLAGRRVAVEVNRRIVPRATHGEHRLQAGDVVEVVQFVGGG